MSEKNLIIIKRVDSLLHGTKELAQSPISSPIKSVEETGHSNQEKLHNENIKYLIDHFSKWHKKKNNTFDPKDNSKTIPIGNVKKQKVDLKKFTYQRQRNNIILK